MTVLLALKNTHNGTSCIHVHNLMRIKDAQLNNFLHFPRMMMNLKKIFSFIGMFGVFLGAFGAHTLKNTVSSNLSENWKTATLYLFVHVFAGLYAIQFVSNLRSAYLFLTGIIIFCGSLYTLVLTKQTFWGAITPIGGVLFILGWFMLMIDSKK